MSKHNRTITEARVQELSERLYGIRPLDRVAKLDEEIKELFSVIIDHSCDSATIDEVKDELSDCLFVLISLIGIYDTNIRELVDMAIYKIKQREINPNFKRDETNI
ncbi:hypothetical protein CCP3SC1AL1_1620006 [Gammaproteobacteria bacterium]